MNKSYAIAEIVNALDNTTLFHNKDCIEASKIMFDDLETIFKIYLNDNSQERLAEKSAELEKLKAENIILNQRLEAKSKFEVNIRNNESIKDVSVTLDGISITRKFWTYTAMHWRIKNFVKKAKATLKDIKE